MTLVDTSVWIQHLRTGSTELSSLLCDEHVLSHLFVIGELACGNLRNREEILGLLNALPRARVAEHREVLHLLEAEQLYGLGIGWTDAHLLASALLTGCSLWTLDKPLLKAANALKISP